VSGFTIEFSPWGKFHARENKVEIKRWLNAVGKAGVEAFRGGMGKYPPASAPGAWPNSRSGKLRASIKYEVGGGGAFNDTVTIGTNTPYSLFLRHGTSKMARRKMSDDALKAGVHAGRLGHWVEWTHG
jgi:hypothetical protein